MKEVEIGSMWGAWKVLEDLGYKQKYKCICTGCNDTISRIRVYDLLEGKSTMCAGCATFEAKRGDRDDMYKSERNIWTHIRQRCGNPNNKDYKNYGGRGIEVCELWQDSFDAFLLFMGPKTTPTCTIERLDCNGNYEPGNCVWLERAEQPLNKRDNVKITLDGETKTASVWSRDDRCKVSQTALYKRIARGWDPVAAILLPSGSKKPK